MNKSGKRFPLWLRGGGALLIFVLLIACNSPRSESLHQELVQLQEDFSPLRTDFNADSGKVRLITLLSPT